MRLLSVAGVAAALFGAVYAGHGNGYFDPPVYPRECAIPCGPVVTFAQNTCLSDPASCLCIQKNMDKLIPRCEACTFNQKNSKNGQTFYPQIKKLAVDICGLKTTSVTLGAAAPTAMPVMAGGAALAIAGYAAM